MRVCLAVYDPSQPSGDGSFWSWYSPSLDRQLLHHFYYDVMRTNRPDDPAVLDESVIVGGLAAYSPNWVFGYRYGNGGRDAHGRRGRFVIVVAGVSRDQVTEGDLSALITCPPMIDLLAKAPHVRPLPVPPELDIDVVAPPRTVDPVLLAKAVREERLELSGLHVAVRAGVVCGKLPADRPWRCYLRVEKHCAEAIIECPRPSAVQMPSPEPVPPRSQEGMWPIPRKPTTRPKRERKRLLSLWGRLPRLRSTVVVGLLLIAAIGASAAWIYTIRDRLGGDSSDRGMSYCCDRFRKLADRTGGHLPRIVRKRDERGGVVFALEFWVPEGAGGTPMGFRGMQRVEEMISFCPWCGKSLADGANKHESPRHVDVNAESVGRFAP